MVEPLMTTGFGELKVFSGSAHPELTKEVADVLGVGLGQARLRRFPDTEVSFQIDENIRGADVFIVQPTCANAGGSVNDHVLELLIMTMRSAARRPHASRRWCRMRLRASGSQRQAARADFGQAGGEYSQRVRYESRADDGPAQSADPGVL
jgi:ribose-phosphate pyrophosphokinase